MPEDVFFHQSECCLFSNEHVILYRKTYCKPDPSSYKKMQFVPGLLILLVKQFCLI